LAPPLVAIGLALVARDVLLSLLLGIWLGTSMLAGGNPAQGLMSLIDTEVRGALVDSDHISIILFSLMLGGMVGVMSRCGGTHGVVRLLEPLATTPRRAQVATWLMGVAIFFDDYSNTLIVGNAMRPVTDRHLVSREKLAFLVDSTAAPVACVALVSTWIGYQVSILGDALVARGSDLNPIAVFLASIPMAFYPVLALTLTLTVSLTGRDWGPMLRAERRARSGHVLGENALPLADYESSGLAPDDDAPRQWWNAAVPVLAVIAITLVGLYTTGRSAMAEAGEVGTGLRDVIGESDPFTALLWASLGGLGLAVILATWQRILSTREALEAAVAGFKSMLMAMVVLTLAWSLGSVCVKLGTADFLVGLVGAHLPAALVPVSVFCVAAAVSFATGTSWGTMGILTPLAVPLALAAAVPGEPITPLLAGTVSAILGGSVFGDHCSPISDTTIMSSMASGCDHVDHVRTQLPYALVAATMAIVFGYIPECFDLLPTWLPLFIGAGMVVLWTRLVGRKVA
jgi:Na+/H+ antiporter NhaC